METFEPASVTEKPVASIATELCAMAQLDQTTRQHWQETWQVWDKTLDKNHTERLKEVVVKIGWPTASKVGSEAASAAWLLVQHADHDPEFQEYCLGLMHQAPTGEIR